MDYYVTLNVDVGKDPGKLEKRKMDLKKRARSWRRIKAKKLMCNDKGTIQGESRFLNLMSILLFFIV